MLLPDTEPEEAAELMEQYRKRIEALIVRHDDQEMSVTVSIGISCAPKDSKNEKTLFERADECLYVAKENGRNQVNTYFQGLQLRYGEKVDLTLLKQVILDDPSDKDKEGLAVSSKSPPQVATKSNQQSKSKKRPARGKH